MAHGGLSRKTGRSVAGTRVTRRVIALRATCVAIALAHGLPGSAAAGTLGDFEGAATAPKSTAAPSRGGSGSGVRVGSNVGENMGGDLTLLAVIGLAAGAEMSLARMRGTPSAYGVNITPRLAGAPR